MQYVGGKQKSGGHRIAASVRRFAAKAQAVVVQEGCCGGLSVTSRLRGLRVEAADACVPLINLYCAIQDGWLPPSEVTRDVWEHYQANPDPLDPMTAFVGFGCSRSGAWFSSFIVDYKYTNRRVPAATAARDSIIRKIAACDVQFHARSYEDTPLLGVGYFDIPYEGTLGYPAVGEFDHGRFWTWAREASARIPILISERVEPKDEFVVVDEWTIQQRLNTPSGIRKVERLFIHERWVDRPDRRRGQTELNLDG